MNYLHTTVSRDAINIQESVSSLLTNVDLLRLVATRKLKQDQRDQKGQFLTPSAIASRMAKMFQFKQQCLSLLDAGAGVGSLIAAVVAELCQREVRPQQLHVTAYEIDDTLVAYLKETLNLCQSVCLQVNIIFSFEIRQIDFIYEAASLLQPGLFQQPRKAKFNCAILNPPYCKISNQSETRQLLRSIGVETSNLYTGFMAATILLLESEGELVTITPRSFCHGPYFKDFRTLFLRIMALQHIHLFDSRQDTFRDDKVLQEIIIVSTIKKQLLNPVKISSSTGEEELVIELPYVQVVNPSDPEKFIRVLLDLTAEQVVEQMKQFPTTLVELGLSVSTGRVVDFRALPYLQARPTSRTVPLIYPVNFTNGFITWPIDTKKPQALLNSSETAILQVPNGNYVLTKRFTTKEQKKRVVTAIYKAEQIASNSIGFENHINYFHQDGHGLDITLAQGLAIYLSSTLVDILFRQFNGSTQVNATDLRNIGYPTLNQLRQLGRLIGDKFLEQHTIDVLIEKELLPMSLASGPSPIAVKNRVEEAVTVLKALGLPRAQLNERSALTLLALLNLDPTLPWYQAKSVSLGITPIMNYMKAQYGKDYAPNTRETICRQTIHQFRDAALIITNPDDPDRPINSPATVYKLEQTVLELLRTYGSPTWHETLSTYLASTETLKQKYAQERQMKRIPINETLSLSPGGQNILIKEICDKFIPNFTPGGKLLYVGDAEEKFALFEQTFLSNLGINIDAHGKMPDLIIHYSTQNWIVLVEAVTSHGPISPQRRTELEDLCQGTLADLVFITAFLSRKAMVQYLSSISWETDVWVADSPEHLIHFNGESLLQIYKTLQ